METSTFNLKLKNLENEIKNIYFAENIPSNFLDILNNTYNEMEELLKVANKKQKIEAEKTITNIIYYCKDLYLLHDGFTSWMLKYYKPILKETFSNLGHRLFNYERVTEEAKKAVDVLYEEIKSYLDKSNFFFFDFSSTKNILAKISYDILQDFENEQLPYFDNTIDKVKQKPYFDFVSKVKPLIQNKLNELSLKKETKIEINTFIGKKYKLPSYKYNLDTSKKTLKVIYSDYTNYKVKKLEKEISLGNPLALFVYIEKVIDGLPFNNNLFPVINDIFEKNILIMEKKKHSFKDMPFNIITKSLMLYYGIGFEKNKLVACKYLELNIKDFNDYAYYSDIDYFTLNTKLFLMDIFKYHKEVDLSFLTLKRMRLNEISPAYLIDFFKGESDEFICKTIDEIFLYDSYSINKYVIVNAYKDIYIPYVKNIIEENKKAKQIELEEKRKVEEEARIQEEKRKVEEEKQLEIINKQKELIKNSSERKTYTSEEIEKLINSNDPRSLFDAASYYFEKGDEICYKIAYDLYEKSFNLAEENARIKQYAYLNMGICLSNFSLLKDEKGQKEYFKKSIEHYKAKMFEKEYLSSLFYYLLKCHTYDFVYEDDIKKQIEDYIKTPLSSEKELTKLYTSYAYNIYKQNYNTASKEAKEIVDKYAINMNYIELLCISGPSQFIRYYNKISDEFSKSYAAYLAKDNGLYHMSWEGIQESSKYRHSPAEIANEAITNFRYIVDKGVELNIQNVILTKVDYCLKGNILFKKDEALAYDLLKSLNGNFGLNKSIYEKKFEELKSKFEVQSKKKRR